MPSAGDLDPGAADRTPGVWPVLRTALPAGAGGAGQPGATRPPGRGPVLGVVQVVEHWRTIGRLMGSCRGLVSGTLQSSIAGPREPTAVRCRRCNSLICPNAIRLSPVARRWPGALKPLAARCCHRSRPTGPEASEPSARARALLVIPRTASPAVQAAFLRSSRKSRPQAACMQAVCVQCGAWPGNWPKLMRDAGLELVRLGCTYIQLDAPHYPQLGHLHRRRKPGLPRVLTDRHTDPPVRHRLGLPCHR
jgi:hypothetical protein